MLGTIGGEPSAISLANGLAIQRLSDAVGCCRAAVCAKPGGAEQGGAKQAGAKQGEDEACTLVDQPTGGWTGLFYQFYRGPFWSAASLAEYLQLLYLRSVLVDQSCHGLLVLCLGIVHCRLVPAGSLYRCLRLRQRLLQLRHLRLRRRQL